MALEAVRGRARENFRTEMAGFAIVLEQRGRNKFRVVYGLQVDDDLNYGAAAAKLGSAIMHAAACEDRLDNRMPGER
jgi:hypothetical protein